MGPEGSKHVAEAIVQMPQLTTVKYAAACRTRTSKWGGVVR